MLSVASCWLRRPPEKRCASQIELCAELMPWTWPHSHSPVSYELGNLFCIFIIPNWYFSDKSPYSQSCGFSSSHVQMWEWDHEDVWALKNWHFWTAVLEKTPESLLSSKEINQPILKKTRPKYSLEGLMLKPKVPFFGHLMWRAESLEKTLMLEKIEGKRRWGWQRKRQLDDIINSMDKLEQTLGVAKDREIAKDREAWSVAVRGVAKSQTWLSDRTTIFSCRNYLEST